jgi:hypothetical protein
MINYYGIFQLVKVHKEDKTRKGDTVVYFTAATRRTEKDTDFKFFKVYGQDADYMLRNLIKGEDGKYKSRKMHLQGYVETYNENQEVKCTANLKPEHIPEQLGFLNKVITINAKTTTQVQRDTYVVKHLEFVDKQNDMDIEVVINDDLTEYTHETPISTNQVGNTGSTKSNKGKTGNFSDSIQATIGEAFKGLDDMKTLEDAN